MSSTFPPPKPPFSALPLKKDGPRGNIWGLFGPNDELGLLNYLTPHVTQQAATEEIRTGVRIAVDLPIGHYSVPMYLRPSAEHKVQQSGDHAAHDDEIKFNTQISTQWDGFRHFGYQDVKLFYNETTLDQIHNSSRIGTHKWVENGGIATRGVLVDLPRWLNAHSMPKKDAFASTKITPQEIREAMEHQDVRTRPGDILFLRTGYHVATATELSGELKAERDKMPLPPSLGVEQSEDMLRFIWDSGVVAVAGDSPTFESWPPPWEDNRFWLHEWLLAGWGCPIGELFDLEKLAKECERQKRWTFFFASMPLHVPGGVASPPGGMVIF